VFILKLVYNLNKKEQYKYQASKKLKDFVSQNKTLISFTIDIIRILVSIFK